VVVLLVLALGALPGLAGADGRPVAVFVADDGTVTMLNEDGTTTSLGRSASIVGPMRDYDGDGFAEVALVDSSGQLSVVDAEGESQTLASGAASGKTTLASGDWDGDGTPAVIYANANDNGYLYRVEVGGQPQRLLDAQTKGAVGVGDYDHDGSRDVVFLGSSSTIKYYDGSTVESTGYSSIGSNNGRGVGQLADFDGNGRLRVPVVDGSNNLALVCHCGEKTTLNGNYQSAAKAPVAAADWTGDDRLEVMHVDTDGNLAYATLGGETGTVSAAGGGSISAAGAAGVAPVVDTTPPEISDFRADNPDGRTVTVSFEASEPLSEIEVDVGGDGSATLSTDAFDESGSGPYTYTATYGAESDGTYEFTLGTAQSAGGDGASGQSATVTVETNEPEITDASLTDLTDGDGAVANGDTVRVSAVVDGVEDGDVTADLGGFGAGTVSLSETSSGTYAASAAVDASSVPDGWVRATVEATNQYDASATAETSELALDTTPPTARAGSDRTVTVGESVSFDGGGSTDSVAIDRYSWDFDDGDTTTGKTAVHEFDAAGTYDVSLTVTDVAGHTDEATVEVAVETPGTTTVAPRSPTTTDTPTNAPETVTATTDTPTVAPGTPIPTDVPTVTADTTLRETSPAPGRTTSVSGTQSEADGTSTSTAGSTGESGQVVEHFDAMSANASGALVTVEARTSADSLDLSAAHAGTAPGDVPALGDRPGIDVVRYVSLRHAPAVVQSATLTVAVERSVLTDADPGDVSVYRYADGSWTRLETTALETAGRTYRYRAVSPGLSTFAIGTADASTSVTHTTLHTREARVGDAVRVTAELHNSGTVEGTTVLTLSVDGSRTERIDVAVPAGERRTVTLTTSFDSPGTYRLALGDRSVGSVEVDAAPARRTNLLGVPRLPGCGVHCDIPLVAAVGLAFGAALVARRRTHRPEEHCSFDPPFNR
jgi:hypothetical protein